MTADEAKKNLALEYLPVTYRRLFEYLEDQPRNILEIANHLGMTINGTHKLICFVRDRNVVCIAEYYWDSAGRRKMRFGLGCKDVKAPPKKTQSERARAYRQKRKAISGEVRLGVWGL